MIQRVSHLRLGLRLLLPNDHVLLSKASSNSCSCSIVLMMLLILYREVMVMMMGMRMMMVVVVLNTRDDVRRNHMERQGLRGGRGMINLSRRRRRRRRRRDRMEIGARGGYKLGSSSVEPAKRNVSRQRRI